MQTASHLVIHQTDPTRPAAAGIDGFVRDLVAHSPARHEFAIIGVDSSGSGDPLGVWRDVEIGARVAAFMPVARLRPDDQRRRVPHSARLIAGLIRHRPDAAGRMVHAHRAEVGAIASRVYPRAEHALFLHGPGIPSTTDAHDSFWRFTPALYERVERVAARRADRVLVMHSGALARVARDTSNAIMGTNWFDGGLFYADGGLRGDSEVVFGWAGRFEAPKDPLKAVETFAAARARGLEFRAWMAGDGTLRDSVSHALRERGLNDAVELVGTVAPDDLASLLRSSHALLLTSAFEGIPRVVLEALACGAPVVSTPAGEVPNIVDPGRSGFIAPAGTPGELAELLERSLELRDRRSVAATVAHLDGRKVVPTLLDSLVA